MIKPLIYILLLLGTFPPDAFADSFIKDFVALNNASQWRPVLLRKHDAGQNTKENDIKEIQSLSYLQGYNPAPLFKNVIKYDKTRAFPGYNLFLSAQAPEAVLMDMNGRTVHQWQYPSSSLPIDHDYYVDYWARARILKDGDLLALVPYGGLLKLDKQSRLLWFKKIYCHHDFDIDSDGNIYTLTVRDSRSKDSAGIKINSIAILSPDGKMKKEISLYGLFEKYPDPSYIKKINALGHSKGFLFFGVYINITGDAFHANSIQVLDGKWAGKNPAFKKGNLLVSIRNLGVLICVDPDKEKIVWLRDKAFWNEGQHSAQMLDNGDILIFDNLYRPNLSRVVEFDPGTMKIVWQYQDPDGGFFSYFLGQEYRLPNGNTLITSSTQGRSFELAPDKTIVWEFYNPHQVDKNSLQFRAIDSKQHFRGRYNKLIAVTNQMQRIPIGPDMDWLKN